MLLRTPKITWGSAFANTLELAFFDNVIAYPEPREGSEADQGASGIETAWLLGTDQVLEGDVSYIPTSDFTDPLATGWDGSTGWRAFLDWARAKNAFRWYPDRTVGTYQPCYLVEPWKGTPRLERDGTRTIRLKIRTTDASVFAGY